MNAEHLTALREAAKALRKVKTDVETVLAAMQDERTLLPERLWRTPVDDDMMETEISDQGIILIWLRTHSHQECKSQACRGADACKP